MLELCVTWLTRQLIPALRGFLFSPNAQLQLHDNLIGAVAPRRPAIAARSIPTRGPLYTGAGRH